jgi:hypothetical protein
MELGDVLTANALPPLRQANQTLAAVCDCDYPNNETYCDTCLARNLVIQAITAIKEALK